MTKAILRWTLLLLALLVIGPTLAHLIRSLRDIDGGDAFTLLVNDSVMKGILLGAAAVGCALVLGVLGARFFALNTGYAIAGLVLGWASWSLGTVDAIIRRANSGADFPVLAIEGGLVTLAAAVISVILSRAAAKHHPAAAAAAAAGTPEGMWGLFFRGDPGGPPAPKFAICLLAAAVACGAVVWLVCVTPLKGQTLFACLLGGMAAGAAANASAGVKTHVQPVVAMLGMVLLAVAGPILARVLQGSGIVEAARADQLLSLARPLSLDWASGALLGVPVGMGWSGAVLDTRAMETAQPPAGG